MGADVNAVNTALFTMFLLLVCTYPAIAANTGRHASATIPGELVDIGTHKLHIYCRGQGTPR